MYPLLIIDFRTEYISRKLKDSGIPYFHLDTLESVRGLCSQCFSMKRGTPIAFGDLAQVSQHVSHLLKFVEGAEVPLIALSSSDTVYPALLSRFMRVLKNVSMVKNKGDDFNTLLNHSEDPDESLTLKKIIEECPSFYVYNSLLRSAYLGRKKQQKLISLILSELNGQPDSTDFGP